MARQNIKPAEVKIPSPLANGPSLSSAPSLPTRLPSLTTSMMTFSDEPIPSVRPIVHYYRGYRGDPSSSSPTRSSPSTASPLTLGFTPSATVGQSGPSKKASASNLFAIRANAPSTVSPTPQSSLMPSSKMSDDEAGKVKRQKIYAVPTAAPQEAVSRFKEGEGQGGARMNKPACEADGKGQGLMTMSGRVSPFKPFPRPRTLHTSQIFQPYPPRPRPPHTSQAFAPVSPQARPPHTTQVFAPNIFQARPPHTSKVLQFSYPLRPRTYNSSIDTSSSTKVAKLYARWQAKDYSVTDELIHTSARLVANPLGDSDRLYDTAFDEFTKEAGRMEKEMASRSSEMVEKVKGLNDQVAKLKRKEVETAGATTRELKDLREGKFLAVKEKEKMKRDVEKITERAVEAEKEIDKVVEREVKAMETLKERAVKAEKETEKLMERAIEAEKEMERLMERAVKAEEEKDEVMDRPVKAENEMEKLRETAVKAEKEMNKVMARAVKAEKGMEKAIQRAVKAEKEVDQVTERAVKAENRAVGLEAIATGLSATLKDAVDFAVACGHGAGAEEQE